MAVGFFITEVIVAFLLAGFILSSYGKIRSATLPILFVVLVAWYFSLLIVTILASGFFVKVFSLIDQIIKPNN